MIESAYLPEKVIAVQRSVEPIEADVGIRIELAHSFGNRNTKPECGMHGNRDGYQSSRLNNGSSKRLHRGIDGDRSKASCWRRAKAVRPDSAAGGPVRSMRSTEWRRDLSFLARGCSAALGGWGAATFISLSLRYPPFRHARVLAEEKLFHLLAQNLAGSRDRPDSDHSG